MDMRAVLILALGAAIVKAPLVRCQSPAPPDNAVVREQGQRIFGSKCGQCHGENARKKLPDGSTLLGRLTASKDWRPLLGTRLKSMNPEDRQAVTLYVESLLREFQSSEKK